MLKKFYWLSALLVALWTTACAPAAGDPAALQRDLDGLAGQVITSRHLMGVGISVQLANGALLTSNAGFLEPAGTMPYSVSATPQVIGSTTKLFTATMIMQLIEEGRLRLDDTIGPWVDVPDKDTITVRMLLSHTSGLNEYITSLSAEERARHWTPRELLARAVERGAVGRPGVGYAHYSNTNFVALALILEAITSRSWEQNVVERIVTPLGLQNTFPLTASNRASTPGWVQTNGEWSSNTGLLDPSVGWGAGAIVATNADLMTFFRAFVEGRLFANRSTLASMNTFAAELDPATLGQQPPTRVGLCVLQYQVGQLVLQGHIGHAYGWDTAALLDPTTGALIVVTTNTEVVGAAALTAVDVATHLRRL